MPRSRPNRLPVTRPFQSSSAPSVRRASYGADGSYWAFAVRCPDGRLGERPASRTGGDAHSHLGQRWLTTQSLSPESSAESATSNRNARSGAHCVEAIGSEIPSGLPIGFFTGSNSQSASAAGKLLKIKSWQKHPSYKGGNPPGQIGRAHV